MKLQPDLEKGLDVIEPFLKQHDFRFIDFENYMGSSSHFTFVKYKNGPKEFHLGYHFSIGHIVYQFDNFAVSHNFYLNKLGFESKMMFEEDQTEDKLLVFQHILSDFDFLVEDFFKGECIKLQTYSKLEDNILKEYDQKARKRYNRPLDEIKIEQARIEFQNKNYKKCMEHYMSIDFKSLKNDLDEKIIEFCLRHI